MALWLIFGGERRMNSALRLGSGRSSSEPHHERGMVLRSTQSDAFPSVTSWRLPRCSEKIFFPAVALSGLVLGVSQAEAGYGYGYGGYGYHYRPHYRYSYSYCH